MALRVLVADDNDAVRSLIVRILKENSYVEVVGESINYAQTLEMTGSLKPDVVILDLMMADEDAFTHEAIKLHLMHNAGCILAISVWNDDDAHRRAVSLGARALIDKACLYVELNRWIESLCS